MADRVEHTTTERYVKLHIVKGGETVFTVQHDAARLEPWDGRYEDVEMRVFGVDGGRVDFRFSAAEMREALRLVGDLRVERGTGDG